MAGQPINLERRAQGINDLLRDHLKDPAAIAFVTDFLSAYVMFDDLIDGDAKRTDDDHWDLLETTLYALPGNPFFLQHSYLLLPVMRAAMCDYMVATQIERDARSSVLAFGKITDEDRAHRLLRASFERRNSVFDVAAQCVEILHGRDARLAFSMPWFAVTRDYELFDVYVAKVTAATRPKKEDSDGLVQQTQGA